MSTSESDSQPSHESVTETESDFVSLATLYWHEHVSIGTLATAIEKTGIWGTDRYRRFRCFESSSKEAVVALDALAHQVATEDQAGRYDQDDDPGVPDPEIDFLYLFGWLRKDLPDLGRIVEDEPPADLKPARRPGDQRKVDGTLIMIIGALWEAIEGRSGWPPHPEYPGTRSAMFDMLVERYRGMRGMSKRTLETRIPEAMTAIDSTD